MTERWACQLVNQPRGTQRYRPTQREDEDRLTQAIIELAKQYGQYGYRRITVLLQHYGWRVGKDRVERIWRREGLKVPQKQKPRVRLRPAYANHVWSYDFISRRTHNGRSVRLLNLIDEYTRECQLIRAERRWSSGKVIEALADMMVRKGIPEHIRSDNGPEFVAVGLRKCFDATGARTLYIEPGSPWENGYCESFNSKLRDESLNGEILYSIKELCVLMERWRVHLNTRRFHSSLCGTAEPSGSFARSESLVNSRFKPAISPWRSEILYQLSSRRLSAALQRTRATIAITGIPTTIPIANRPISSMALTSGLGLCLNLCGQ